MTDPNAESPHEGIDSQEARFHRRGFFSEGLRHLLKPLAEVVEQRMEGLDPSIWNDLAGDDEAPQPPESQESRPLPVFVRPPGALPEGEFLARCTSSGRCVLACPVSAIKHASVGDSRVDRKPIIEPRIQACVLCDELSCMKSCPSGALQSLTRDRIRMGLAVLRRDLCVRTRGEDCRICVDKCPVGRTAVDIPQPGADVTVNAEACTGCGMCEMHCPVEPQAIAVEKRV